MDAEVLVALADRVVGPVMTRAGDPAVLEQVHPGLVDFRADVGDALQRLPGLAEVVRPAVVPRPHTPGEDAVLGQAHRLGDTSGTHPFERPRGEVLAAAVDDLPTGVGEDAVVDE